MEFPSFGELLGDNVIAYAKALAKIVERHGTKEYFQDTDYDRYTHRVEIIDFIAEFAKWIKQR